MRSSPSPYACILDVDARLARVTSAQSPDLPDFSELGAAVRVAEISAGELVALALLASSPLLLGIPVALGILTLFIRILGTGYPCLGEAIAVDSDAEQVHLGHTLYQNPTHGYTGLIYTPLFPISTGYVHGQGRSQARSSDGRGPNQTPGCATALDVPHRWPPSRWSPRPRWMST
jgi:hypothetical protein